MTRNNIYTKPIATIKPSNKYFTCQNFARLSVLIFMVSFLTQLYVSNKLAIKSQNLVAYENERKVLEKDLSELKLELSHYSSLSYIETEAKKLGFVENTSYISTITTNHTTALAIDLDD